MTLVLSFFLLAAGIFGAAWARRRDAKTRSLKRRVVSPDRLSGPRWSLVPLDTNEKLSVIDYDPGIGDPRVDPENDVARAADEFDVN